MVLLDGDDNINGGVDDDVYENVAPTHKSYDTIHTEARAREKMDKKIVSVRAMRKKIHGLVNEVIFM